MCRLLQDDRVPLGDRVEDFGKLAHRSGFRSQTRREMGEGVCQESSATYH